MDRRRRRRLRRARRSLTLIASAVACAGLASSANAQTSLTGSSIVLKSNASTTRSSQGYLGTYLLVPAGGAPVNLTATATAAAGAPAPHMNLLIADSISGFTVNSNL